MSDTEGEELKMPEFPPGTLPPVGLPGNFLRRVKDDDTKHGSRSSSLAARRRKKKWDDGIGPGGPISQSAIFPQRRSQADQPLSPSFARGSTDQSRRDDEDVSPTDVVVSPGPLNEKGPDRSSTSASPTDERRNPIEVYAEGNNLVIENREGEVISVQPLHGGETSLADQAKDLARNINAETDASGWTYDALKKRVMNWRDVELAKRKGKGRMSRRGEPARAYQFGSTVCSYLTLVLRMRRQPC